MIVGRVNSQCEPIIEVVVRSGPGAAVSSLNLDAILDTGFNHELTLPPERVRLLELEYAAPVQATLAGDVRVFVDLYRAIVVWDGSEREVAVLEMEGAPLVGMTLLTGRRLTIDVRPDGAVRIE